MMDYIKKLRACIRAFQELDTNHTREHLELSKQIEDEKQRRLDAGFPCCNSFLKWCFRPKYHVCSEYNLSWLLWAFQSAVLDLLIYAILLLQFRDGNESPASPTRDEERRA